ncbi:flagellar basal body rod C-terminal domain-containing protein [Undibacterium sp.]|uniref:flagellar basal body rod C-terminal domain-containing protein n=1 Tax=Undibacterium sp. TaxID=1914977 RepID=UPI003753B0F4
MAISSLSIGVSGMMAYQGALDSSANNVANALTKGYQVQVASFQENTNGGVRVNISKESQELAAQDNQDKLSSTDLATEITNSLQYKAGFELSAKMVKVADEVLSSLLDISK